MNTVLIIYILCWIVCVIMYIMKFRECTLLKKKLNDSWAFKSEMYNKFSSIVADDKLSAEEKISELKFEIDNVPF